MEELLASSRVGCIVRDRLVVLDLAASRFFLAPRLGPDDGDAPIARPPRGFVEVLAWPHGCEQTSKPTRHLLASPSVNALPAPAEASVSLMSRLAWEEWRASMALRRGIAIGLRRSAVRVTHGLSARTRSDVATAASRSTRVWRSRDRCLPRSIGLARLLRRSGCPASVVVGVSLDPFCAHAWVQEGNAVLNDDLDHVLLFTPILST